MANGNRFNWNFYDPRFLAGANRPMQTGGYALPPQNSTMSLASAGQRGQQGGLPLFDPTTIAMGGAGSLVGAIADWLGGGQQRKDEAWGRRELKSQYGQDIFDPRQITGQKKLSYMANLGPLAEAANRKLGLGHGQAWNEMLWRYANQEGVDLADIEREEV